MAAAVGRLLRRFPQTDLAVAYGSGVFQQRGYAEGARPMIDLLLAVRDPRDWHARNLAANRGDYSGLALGGAALVAAVQESGGARLYFNSNVRPAELEGGQQEIKYGVISTDALLADLREWRWLYAAGRLHKPVLVATEGARLAAELRAALDGNLRAAVRAAALLLPRDRPFSERELFAAIAGLSYGGDFRMTVGENPHKVSNIVEGSLPRFRSLYESPVADVLGAAMPADGELPPVASEAARRALCEGLPPAVAAAGPDGVQGALAGIVRASSLSQSLKGVATAGVLKSVRYAGAKLAKQWGAST